MSLRRAMFVGILAFSLVAIVVSNATAALQWVPTAGDLNEFRTEHVVVSLADGRVLVSGGNNNSTVHKSAEIYDPVTRIFTPHPTGLNVPRSSAQATRLANGKVLICGGSSVMVGGALNSCEVYDPAANTFTPTTNSMLYPRAFHTMTLLADGKVLIAGGSPDRGIGRTLNTAEVFDPGADPVNGTFNPVNGTLSQPRMQHSAARLQDGRVFIASGSIAYSSQMTWTTDLYDPVTNSLSAGPTVPLANSLTGVGSLGLLDDGDVLLTNVFSVLSPNINYPNSYRYDPQTNTYTRVGDLNIPRFSTWPILRLSDGRFINIGGRVPQPSGVLTNTTEIFDPTAAGSPGPGLGAWTLGPNTNYYRLGAGNKDIPFTLEDGSILVAGGYGGTSPSDFSLSKKAEVLVDTNTPVGNSSFSQTFPQGFTVTVEFTGVTTAGQTQIKLLASSPPLGTDFQLSTVVCPNEDALIFDIGTSAVFPAGGAVVTINFAGNACMSGQSNNTKKSFRLLHFDVGSPPPTDATDLPVNPGLNEITSVPLSSLSPFVVAVKVLDAALSIDPKTLNIGTAENRGRSVMTLTIEAIENGTPADVEPASVVLLGASPIRASLEDGKLVLKFLRSDLDLSGLSAGSDETLEVTGRLMDGRSFRGSDVIRTVTP